MTNQGSFYMLIPPVLAFLSLSNTLLKEKGFRLRSYLHVVGVSSSAYWTSYMVTSLLNSLLLAVVMYLSGRLFLFQFFLQQPGLWIFLVFFSLSFSLQLVAMLIAVVSPTQLIGNSLTYSIMMTTFLVQLFLAHPLILQLLHMDTSFLSVAIKLLLDMYPPAVFSKIWLVTA